MRRWFPLLAVVFTLALAAPVLSQIEDHPEPVPPKRASAVKLGGGIGIAPQWLFLDLDPLNSVLAASNAATFSDGSLYMSGIQGYAYIILVPNLRVGGIGAGGSLESSSLEQSTNTRRNVKLSVNLGGVTVDYVIPVVPRIDLTVGGMLGGGTMKLAMNRDDGSGKVWTDIWGELGSGQPAAEYTRTLEGSFFLYQPTVSVEVALTRWLGMRVGGSYLGAAGNSWKLDDRYDVVGVPDDIRPKGFMLTTGLFLGTFIY
jgi:hypothetical protein